MSFCCDVPVKYLLFVLVFLLRSFRGYFVIKGGVYLKGSSGRYCSIIKDTKNVESFLSSAERSNEFWVSSTSHVITSSPFPNGLITHQTLYFSRHVYVIKAQLQITAIIVNNLNK